MSDKLTILEKVNKIQVELKAHKSQFNKFGDYSYRSCEDILESLKPFLKDLGLIINISDQVEMIGNRFYIKAIAKLIEIETGEYYETTAFAREAESKKGMDSAQVTGATSSYARKYALNGLLAIDDTKDNDFYDNRDSKENNTIRRANNNNKNNNTNRMTLNQAKNMVLNFGDFHNMKLGQLAKENIGAVKSLYNQAPNKELKDATRLILRDYQIKMKEIKELEEATKQSDFFDENFQVAQEVKES